jgi:hypothetical protein
MADFSEMKKNFAELMALPNVTFDMSYKYSKAHMYATAVPGWMTDNETEGTPRERPEVLADGSE